MSGQKQHPQDWADLLREIIRESEESRAALCRIEQWVWHNVVAHDVLPRELPPDLGSHLTTLSESLRAVSDAAGKVFARLCSEPLSKCVMGRMLSEEQFHLVQAMGFWWGLAKATGIAEVTEYELFQHLYYEDDECRCYINVGLGIGWQPETLRLRGLRAGQKAFFEKHLPSVLARFRRD